MTRSTPGLFDNVRLHVEYIDVASLRAELRRTKKHNARQLKKLAAVIDRTGFNVPVIVDEQLVIVAGHARVEAAKLLGMTTIPVIRIAHLSREQLRLFAIFDNKIASEGTIDLEAVHVELSEIVIAAPELDLTDSGFAIAEIDAMNGLHRTQELDDLDEDPLPPAVPVSQVGDLWLLGRHRVACGDSTDADVIARLVNGRMVRALVSDPPYNLAIPGVVSGKGRVKHDDFIMASGEMSRSEFVDFLSRFIAATQSHLVDGALALLFMDWRHIGELLDAGRAQGMGLPSDAGMGEIESGDGRVVA